MKNLLEKFQTILKRFKKTKNSYIKPHIHPHRDWFYILVTSNIIVLMLIIYSVNLYIEINSDKFVQFDPNKSEAEVKLNTNLLTKIVEDLSNRERNINTLSNSKVPQDPSR